MRLRRQNRAELTHATAHQEHKKTWLQLAAHWDRLAHGAERYPGGSRRQTWDGFAPFRILST